MVSGSIFLWIGFVPIVSLTYISQVLKKRVPSSQLYELMFAVSICPQEKELAFAIMLTSQKLKLKLGRVLKLGIQQLHISHLS